MGDLKVSEGFLDAVMIRTGAGAAATGLLPTCTVTNLTTGVRVGLTVAEVSDGIYKVTDWAPAADTEYLTEWAVAGTYTIYSAYKLFKVGGGRTEDIYDLIKATGDGDVEAIKDQTDLIVAGGATEANVDATEAKVDTAVADIAAVHVHAQTIETDVAAVHVHAQTIETAVADVHTDVGTANAAIVVIDGFHDVPTADVATNAQMRDVVGNKADIAVMVVGTTKSILAYVKGIITMHTKPAADSTNNVYPSDVIGSKDDAVQQTVGTTRSLMAYVKALLTNLTSTRAGYLDKLVGSDTAATHGITTANDLAETQMFEIAKTIKYRVSIYIDIQALITAAEGGTVTFRMYNKIDETNYKLVSKVDFVIGTDVVHPSFEAGMINHYTKVTVQCSADVTATRTINYRYMTMDLE